MNNIIISKETIREIRVIYCEDGNLREEDFDNQFYSTENFLKVYGKGLNTIKEVIVNFFCNAYWRLEIFTNSNTIEVEGYRESYKISSM